MQTSCRDSHPAARDVKQKRRPATATGTPGSQTIARQAAGQKNSGFMRKKLDRQRPSRAALQPARKSQQQDNRGGQRCRGDEALPTQGIVLLHLVKKILRAEKCGDTGWKEHWSVLTQTEARVFATPGPDSPPQLPPPVGCKPRQWPGKEKGGPAIPHSLKIPTVLGGATQIYRYQCSKVCGVNIRKAKLLGF